MIIRQLTPEDALEHEKVASQAFIYTFNPHEKQELPAKFMLGSFKDDNKTLMGEIQCDTRRGHFGDTVLSCAAVSGVASKPEYRHGGAIRALFRHLYDNNGTYGFDYSVLYPFSERYYEKFGYINAGFCVRARIPMAELEKFPVDTSLWLYEGKNRERLLSVYNAWAKRYIFGFMREDDAYFSAKPYDTARYTYVYDENGRDTGFVTLTVNRNEGCLTVHEIGFLTPIALSGLLGFLRVFSGDCRSILFEKLPCDSEILCLLNEYHTMQLDLRALGAIRVMNLKRIVENTVFPMGTGSFTFLSRDVIPENAGCFCLGYEQGKGHLERIPEGRCDVEFSASALSEAFIGGLPSTFEALAYGNGTVINRRNPAVLLSLPKKNIFFTDSF